MTPDPELTDAWDLHSGEFPEQGAVADQLAFCVRYAQLAPSGHNTQPWSFRVDGARVEVFADRSRALPVVDPGNRELTISCGAALETLLVAMRRFGLDPNVQLVEDAKAQDLLVRVVVGVVGPAVPNPLFDAITQRHTDRVAFEQVPLPAAQVRALEAAGGTGEAWFQPIAGDRLRSAVSDLVMEGDRLQMADAGFRRELSHWVHANRSKSRDGMPGYAFGIGDLASLAGPLVIRTFDTGASQAAKDHELAVHSPLLGAIVSKSDRRADWLSAGRALMRVLLRATADGLTASYLNQPVEVPALRTRLTDLLEAKGPPQLLLRLGHAPPARATPRRRLEEVWA
jgi:hypothetical protein